jgi:hypothetical protein
MLEIRPICENCGKNLPNESTEAMICSFECTYCEDCVNAILYNVCPNCGGVLKNGQSGQKGSCKNLPPVQNPI